MELAGPFPELKPNTTSSPRVESDPYLADFTRLGELIYYYTPASTPAAIPPGGKTRNPDPDLIIICSWMYAFSKHIAKYTKIYQSKYPSSPILLLRQDGGDFFWRTTAQQMKNLAPAITTIRHLQAKKNDSERLNVLTHIFSNGGAWTVCQLADAYSSAMSLSSSYPDTKPELLPISALILDSTPSLPNPSASHTAICEALPKKPPLVRAIGEAAVWCYISLAQNVDFVLGREHLTLNIRRRMNELEGAFMQDGLRRVYIYSQGDTLIPAADVEAHAKDAMGIVGEGGEERLNLEDFGQTKHVSHMVGNPDRYWSIVDRLWTENIASGI